MIAMGRNRRLTNIGGVKFDLINTTDVSPIVQAWRQDGHWGYITLVNPHSVMLCRRDPRMQEATGGADLRLPDGVGIVLAAKLLGHGRRHRVAGPNLMLHLCDAGRELGFRHYFYGGREGVAMKLAERLSTAFPGMKVAGTFCPPFRDLDAAEDSEIVARINAAAPDIVWVGMGAPKQEKWMADHIGRIKAAALIGVGAAFDFHSGNVQWAPRWVRSIGCEWAYRLVLEPRRMWRRNLDSPLFMGCIGLQAVSERLARVGQFFAPAFSSDDHFGDGGSNGAAQAGGGSRVNRPRPRPRRALQPGALY